VAVGWPWLVVTAATATSEAWLECGSGLGRWPVEAAAATTPVAAARATPPIIK